MVIVKSNLILFETPKAVANLKIVVEVKIFLFSKDIIYFSASTFDLAYKEIGFKGCCSSASLSSEIRP